MLFRVELKLLYFRHGANTAGKYVVVFTCYSICMLKHRQKDIDIYIYYSNGEKDNKSKIKTSFSGGLPLKMKGDNPHNM